MTLFTTPFASSSVHTTGARKKGWQYSRAIYKRCILGLLQPCPLPGGREREGEPHRRNAFGLSRVCTIWTSRNYGGLLSAGGAIREKRQQQHTSTETQEGKVNGGNGGLINEIMSAPERWRRERMNNDETCWLRTAQLATSERLWLWWPRLRRNIMYIHMERATSTSTLCRRMKCPIVYATWLTIRHGHSTLMCYVHLK